MTLKPGLALMRRGTVAGARRGAGITQFITRNASTGNLEVGSTGQRFRFAGTNMPGVLGLSENNNAYGSTYTDTVNGAAVHLATHSEVDAALDMAQALGCTVIRCFALLSIGSTYSIHPTLATWPTANFEPTDYAIQQCRLRGIRLIFPLVDNYAYFHNGKSVWCNAVGVTPDADATQFFTDTTNVVPAFLNHVSAVLDHVNPYTGVAYKNEPAILGWETGNELSAGSTPWGSAYSTWTNTVATHIKTTKAAQQLVIDGHYGIYMTPGLADVDTASLSLTNVDIYSNHAYDEYRGPKELAYQAGVAHSYGKAFIVGEYQWKGRDPYWELANQLSVWETTPQIDGSAFWECLPALSTHGGGQGVHRPGDDADMQARGSQLIAHASRMASSTFPKVMICTHTAAAQSGGNRVVTFYSQLWTPTTDDLIVLFCDSVTPTTITVPSGWVNPLGGTTVVSSDSHTGYVLTHRVTSAEQTAGTVSWTLTGVQGNYDGICLAVVLRGVDTTTPIDAFATTFSSGDTATPHTLPGLAGASLGDNSMVISCVLRDGLGTWTTPDGWGVLASISNQQAGWVGVRNARTSAGVTIPDTSITPNSGDEFVGITLAFTPAGGGGGGGGGTLRSIAPAAEGAGRFAFRLFGGDDDPGRLPDDLTTYQLYMISPYMTAMAAAIRAANPDAVILAYKDSSSMRRNLSDAASVWCPADGGTVGKDWGVQYCDTATNHPNWFMKVGGSNFEYSGYAYHWHADVNASGYKERWASNVGDDLSAHPVFDGVLIDNVLTDIRAYTPGSVFPDGYPTLASGHAAYKAFMDHVGIAGAGAIHIIGNMANARLHAGLWDSYIANQTGGYDEAWITFGDSGGGVPNNLPVYAQGWNVQMAELDQCVTDGKLGIWSAQSQGLYECAIYGYASFLLGTNGTQVFMEANYDADGVDYRAARPMYSWNLGAASGARTEPQTSLFRRNFASGVVLVNADNTTNRTGVSLGGTYTDEAGSSVTSVNVNARRARILRA